MEDRSNREILDGREYERFFPKATGEIIVIKRFAKLEDTIKFLPDAIEQTLYQTKLIAPELTKDTIYNTCKRVWDFYYDHIRYHKDPEGKEAIRSPQNSWYYRGNKDKINHGIDCDDFTVIIASTMRNVQRNGFKYKIVLRIAMYNREDGYQHIYPVIVLPNRGEIIMDCVAKKFNYEVPYIKKIDKNMELQFLNGIPESRSGRINKSIDADDLLDGLSDEEIGDLGKGGKLKAKIKKAVKKVANSKVVKVIKKGVHVINRINPAAALLRVGILTSLKMNLMKVAETLRFSYLDPQKANAMGYDPAKIKRLVPIRQRMEKIFFGAGGKVENFKEAILKGRGNRDKQVPLAGLGSIDYNDYHQGHHVRQILGEDMYNSEVRQVEGLGSLGVVTSAAVAAATTVMGAIAALLKSIGSLKKKKDAGAKTSSDGSSSAASDDNSSDSTTDTSTNDNTAPSDDSATPADTNTDQPQNDTPLESDSTTGGGAAKTSQSAQTAATSSKTDGSSNSTSSGNSDDGTSTGDAADNTTDGGDDTNALTAKTKSGDDAAKKTEEGLVAKVKSWVKDNPLPATGVALVVVGSVIYGVVKLFSKGGDKPKHSLAGLPQKKKKKTKHHKKHFHSHKIKIHKLR